MSGTAEYRAKVAIAVLYLSKTAANHRIRQHLVGKTNPPSEIQIVHLRVAIRADAADSGNARTARSDRGESALPRSIHGLRIDHIPTHAVVHRQLLRHAIAILPIEGETLLPSRRIVLVDVEALELVALPEEHRGQTRAPTVRPSALPLIDVHTPRPIFV